MSTSDKRNRSSRFDYHIKFAGNLVGEFKEISNVEQVKMILAQYGFQFGESEFTRGLMSKGVIESKKDGLSVSVSRTPKISIPSLLEMMFSGDEDKKKSVEIYLEKNPTVKKKFIPVYRTATSETRTEEKLKSAKEAKEKLLTKLKSRLDKMEKQKLLISKKVAKLENELSKF